MLSDAAARWHAGYLKASLAIYKQAQRFCIDNGLVYFDVRVAIEGAGVLIDIGDSQTAAVQIAERLGGCTDKEKIYALANLGAAAFECMNGELLSEVAEELSRANAILSMRWTEAAAEGYGGYSSLLQGRSSDYRRALERVQDILTGFDGLALNEPSYILIFCTRAIEDVHGRAAAHSWLLGRLEKDGRRASRVARLRLDLELARLCWYTDSVQAIESVTAIVEQAESTCASAINASSRWLLRRFMAGNSCGWRQLAEVHAGFAKTS